MKFSHLVSKQNKQILDKKTNLVLQFEQTVPFWTLQPLPNPWL